MKEIYKCLGWDAPILEFLLVFLLTYFIIDIYKTFKE